MPLKDPLMLIPVILLLSAIPAVAQTVSSDTNDTHLYQGPYTLPGVEPFDWNDWDGDRDGDLVQDVLEGDRTLLEGDLGMIGINIHLDHPPRERDAGFFMDLLEEQGAHPVLHAVGRYSTALYFSLDLDFNEFENIASAPGVTMVEYRPVMQSDLDVSNPATRSRESGLYSPETAWNLGYTGEGVVVAVIDSGVDNTVHESLRGKYVYGVDFTGTTVVYGLDPDDIDGHGTHVAGTVMGTGGQAGTYMGTAPGAELVDLRYAKIQGDFTGSADRALEWVIENHLEYDIRVVSCSWGSTVMTSGRDTTSNLVNRLVDEGVVVVVAAGNDGEQGLPSPASADKAITVGALTDHSTIDRSDDDVEWYSNRGPRASDNDLDNMDELKPDIIAPGTNIRAPKHNSVRDYVDMTGTSMATPHVSGIVALMLQANPGLTPTDVKSILRDTAQQTAGTSLPQLDSKYNYRTGWGIIDAYGAVKRAQDLLSTRIEAPSNVRLNDPFGIEVSGTFTKTSYDTQSDELVMELRTPVEWGVPSDMDMDPGAQTATSSVSGPTLAGSEWLVRGRATYNFTIEGARPTLSAWVRPMGRIGDTRSIRGSISINGVEGSEAVRNATITYDSNPPDLSVTPLSIWFSDTLPESGDELDITARVNNTGSMDANDVMVRFIDGPQRTGRTIGERIIDVEGKGHGIATITWEANPGVHAITVVVDPDDVIEESNEDNNSAERPLTVVGLNPPPIAQLEVSPGSGTTITEFTFDGTGSSDTNLRGGSVVEYNFDFGDGEDTGWVDEPVVTHIYRQGGSYTASLVVRDNGGAQSTNDARAELNVTAVSSEELDLFFDSSYGLSSDPGDPAPVDVPVSFTPGNLGRWESSTVERTIVMHSAVMADLTLKAARPSLVIIKVDILGPDDSYSETIQFSHPGGSINRTAGIIIPIDEMTIPFGTPISIGLYMGSNSTDVEFWTGGSSIASILYYMAENLEPTVYAGEDMDVKAGERVEFSGTGSDPDGEIILVRWDVDSDGEWDHEGENGYSFEYSGYGEEGQYTAVMEVQDDDGYLGRDTLNVLVRSRDYNYPPEVAIDCPVAPLTGRALVTGTSSDDQFVEYVEVMLEGGSDELQWSTAKGKEAWRIELDTRTVQNGMYLLKARSFDGQRYSPTAECEVEVFNPNTAPSILRVVAAPIPVSLDGETTLRITAEVEDPDLPSDDIMVSIDMSPIGGPVQIFLLDDGSAPDTIEGDNVFTVDFIPSTNAPIGEFELSLEAVDLAGERDEASIVVEFVSKAGIDIELSSNDVETGDQVLVEVRVDTAIEVSSVRLYSPGFLGEEGLELGDDGREGDRIAGDGTYSKEIVLDLSPGSYDFEVRVVSVSGSVIATDTFIISVQDIPTGSEVDNGPLITIIIAGAVLISLLLVILVIVLQRRQRELTMGDSVENAHHPVAYIDHRNGNAVEAAEVQEGPLEIMIASVIEE
ncbi:MAG: S8 family serine peptidase [Thermoplasmatota archaeon]